MSELSKLVRIDATEIIGDKAIVKCEMRKEYLKLYTLEELKILYDAFNDSGQKIIRQYVKRFFGFDDISQ